MYLEIFKSLQFDDVFVTYQVILSTVQLSHINIQKKVGGTALNSPYDDHVKQNRVPS